ncbi:MAG: phosphoenolpyruvate synthase, pyruvate, water dikinase [Candidatus Gottesmanbacteria bacterium GW2011_GWA2_43_14]|uniref:Phosphoenolpyruvate synthase n=1 Tax=Candidatus Gottesmanbacteria bacterium GW2011_GWA2_43_14 TaxID=1618443 RepID=A0A0G1FTG1_9BACT|nr:MAG: phosphoenolpyruvate synthase, pyruvate, water dikinase [Candidatus Gottesmanbacteria bacterium GW2011_GWA2_43_14]
MRKYKYVVWFDEIDKEDIPVVGGKGANLGEMFKAKIPVPYGFVVTSQSYFQFLRETKLDRKIADQLKNLDHHNSNLLNSISKNIRNLILSQPIPEDIAREIIFAYTELTGRSQKKMKLLDKLSSLLKNPYVAVRSSATAEDLPGASFAGQQDTYLNVSGEASVIRKVHESWASLFTSRAMFYREEQKFDHMKVGLASVVQQMVASDASGVMFTVDPVTNDKKKITIEAILGLGELIVQGSVTPDHYEVDKETMEILVRHVGDQKKKLVKKGSSNAEIRMTKTEKDRQKISDDQVREIAALGKKLEKHYYFPQDIEWAVDKGHVYIVQTRPITTFSEKEKTAVPAADLSSLNLKLLLSGDPASPGIKSGPVKIIHKASEIEDVKAGDVLVTVQTNPDFVPAMKKAVAIVTERGGRTSHAAIVSRELGIPAVVGTGKATKVLPANSIVTVDGAQGKIYQGAFTNELKALTEKVRPSKSTERLKTATKVYVNLATPNRVEEVAAMNADGVGLLRAEFMIADIGVHPRKLIKDKRQHFFIDKLGGDLLKFCRHFNPRPVVYRATDFKTNEYRNLIGGKEYEPEEPNPMLGYRGAFRYMSDPEVFNLELETIKMVRNKHGLKNLWLMLPFVRTVRELIEVKKIISASGLSRSASFKLWMMVEIPSNVILLDKFCEAGIDGVSIGSNDLTMLILGTDRDNTEVSPEFDERNEAVTWAIERVITIAKKYKVTTSICGQAPSDYPELVEKLVSLGITSMSVNADALDKVRETVAGAEMKLAQKVAKK